MTTLSVAWFILVSVIAVGLSASILLAVKAQLKSQSIVTHALLAFLILASGILLLRPHADTFTGLDTSCYRLMAHAFASGRQLHDTDRTLLEIPKSLRRSVLLEYKEWGRDTRDRSFQITSLKNGAIQPYFYPFLPMAAAGLDVLASTPAGDYFVPVLGLLLFTLVLATGAALGRKYGLITSAALLIGSPLPAYLFRGYYAEAAAAGLAVIVILGLSLSVKSRLFQLFAPLALGLAVCFHPVAIILALPALIMILLEPTLSRKGTVWSLAGFSAGLIPLWAMTVWGCQPYGTITDWHSFYSRLSAQPLQQLLGVFVVAFLAGLTALAFGSAAFKSHLASVLHRAISHPALFLMLLLIALLPFAVPMSFWPGKALVMRGAEEYWSGVGWGYGAVLLAGLIASFWVKDQPRSRALLLLSVILASFFFYLKGFEQMGLWSQRRLIPLVVLLIIAQTPLLAAACACLAFKAGRVSVTLMSGTLLAAALLNVIQWPAPYLARHERGSTEWVDSVSKEIGNRLAFFDYYPYSVPFAASGSSRVIGLSEFGYSALPNLSKWLAQRAGQEEVLWVSAFSNPGLEDGVILQSLGHQTAGFDRIVSKKALPALCRKYVVDIEIMRGVPVNRASLLAVRKILDDGPLALRGAWGPRHPLRQGSRLLPARWSRQGSGIIGPIPRPGQSVRISIEAAASRDDGISGQVLRVAPPWPGPALALAVSNDFSKATGLLTRPADKPTEALTGIYTFFAESPYDPGKAGIRGYPNDLGARIHLIAIEEVDEPL